MLTFLKKHYEKVVFIAFLIVFIVALIWQIQIIMAAFAKPEILVEGKKPDYHRLQMKDYAVITELSKEPMWKKSVARNKNDRDFTDLLNPIRSARCPHCEKIIPESNFSIDHKCSMCGQELEDLKWQADTNLDTDEDGIPDKVELENKLNDKDPADAYDDLDEDGFPNIYEYKTSKTKLNDPKSRPALIHRIVVSRIKRTKLPIVIKSVKTNNSDNKAEWLIQAENKRKRRTYFWELGKEIKIGKDRFKITDINYKSEKQFDKSIKTHKDVDVSEVTLQKLDKKGKLSSAKPVVAVVGETVYEPKEKISLKDIVSSKRYSNLYQGDTFIAGDTKTGKETYKIVKVNPQRKIVQVQELNGDKPGKLYDVKRNSFLEEIVKPEFEEKEQPKDRRMMDPARAPGPPRGEDNRFNFKRARIK